MKKSFSLLLLLGFALSAFAQQTSKAIQPKAASSVDTIFLNQLLKVIVKSDSPDSLKVQRLKKLIEMKIDELKQTPGTQTNGGGGEDGFGENGIANGQPIVGGGGQPFTPSAANPPDSICLNKLKGFYNTDQISFLYEHSNSHSLKVHQGLLGSNYPKVIDTLLTLHQCRQVLEGPFDATKNARADTLLQKMPYCRARIHLEQCLFVHKRVQDTVRHWLQSEPMPSLQEAVGFVKYVDNTYRVHLATDFPYLRKEVFDAVFSSGAADPSSSQGQSEKENNTASGHIDVEKGVSDGKIGLQ